MPVARISILVPAGETETRELTDDSVTADDYADDEVGDGGPDTTCYLDRSGGQIEREVRCVQPSTSTTDTP